MRHFKNFLEAYNDYALDGHVPDKFHIWSGISILAATVGRKVSISQYQGKVMYYPNFYVMLVSHPGVGKSTAIDRGVDLVEALRKHYEPELRIIPQQATEPALVKMMKGATFYQSGTSYIQHSSGFFYCGEASASALQNTAGDFVSTLTQFYDCPKMFRKGLKSEDLTEIENICMNMLAGTTFDYLKTLVNGTSVLGGFASRLVYVIAKERSEETTGWDDNISAGLNFDTARKLVEDLHHIYKISGNMRATASFAAAYDEYAPKFRRYLIDLDSNRMESIMVRKLTHIVKLSMLLALSEGDTLLVDGKHFQRAVEMIEEVTADNSFIVSSALMSDTQSQSGLSQLLGQAAKACGGKISMMDLKGIGLKNGNNVTDINETISFMINSGILASDGNDVRLLVDPDTYL